MKKALLLSVVAAFAALAVVGERALAQGIALGGKDRCYNMNCVVSTLTTAASSYVQTKSIKDDAAVTRIQLTSDGSSSYVATSSACGATHAFNASFTSSCASNEYNIATFYDSTPTLRAKITDDGEFIGDGEGVFGTGVDAGSSQFTGSSTIAGLRAVGVNGLNAYTNASAADGNAAVNCTAQQTNGIGCWGVGTGSNPSLKATHSSTGSGLFADTSAGSGYAVEAKADTTSPTKAALHMEPQNADPSSGAAGDLLYQSTLTQLRLHDGTRWNTIAKTLIGSATLDIANTLAQTCNSASTITVTGVSAGTPCVLGFSGAANGDFTCYVSGANTVTVRFCNPTAGAIDPASATYYAVVFQ